MSGEEGQTTGGAQETAIEPLIVSNEKHRFIRHRGDHGTGKLMRRAFMEQCSLPVIDAESLKMIQVLRLHEAMDHTQSLTGSATLLRSLIHPLTDPETIRSRQASLREIASSDRLRQALADGVSAFTAGENALYTFFNKGLYALFPYRDFKAARKSAVGIARALDAIPDAESSYLGNLLDTLQAYAGSAIDRMMNGPIYKTFSGLKPAGQVGLLTPKVKFVPRRFSRWILAGPAIALSPFLLARLGFEHAVSPLMFHIGVAWTGIHGLYALLFKPLRDTDHFIDPFREACVHDPAFGRAVDAVGMIDELLSLHAFAQTMPHAVVLPTVTDNAHHTFEAVGLKNPVMALDDPDFVPNDVCMNGARLSFISGPNSGGKTTVCKSIVHNQLLAQMGGYVVAEEATINIADMIRYQAPKFDGLEDDEGRFGTELARTRDIFFSTSPRSLVILDELAEGTTVEERMQAAAGIMDDFYAIGNNTVLVTHNHSLVDRFMEQKKGQGLMAAFDGDRPTYRLVPGISRVSHAERIAERIGFSDADRQRYLEEKGYR